ncbi:M28 family peptidase [Aquimarina rhabdastrellae]
MIKKILPIVILLTTIFWSFYSQKPTIDTTVDTDTTSYSLANALRHLKVISEKPHHVGTEAHDEVRDYLFNELKALGLSPQIQKAESARLHYNVDATTITNVIAKIEGKKKGKSLLLAAHYDSVLASAPGASDAGSGIVTILEGIRAFLAQKKIPDNDIIILFSDAEELGLLGANAFVADHEWAKDIGLVLNFEGRGSGGPAYMFIETNGKNEKLLSEYIKASPNYPITNSLLYSIYKTLPNDTDLTVFKEDLNINGFNFAFIDDHFDYHTMQDNYDRIDRQTLLHQGDNLMTILSHFAFIDLDNLDSDMDHVFVNFPWIKIIQYPFSWIAPMLIFAVLSFIVLLLLGIKKQYLSVKGIFTGFIPFLIALILCPTLSFGLWELSITIHPDYQEITHGFTYNGYFYILMFAFFNVFLLTKVYHPFVQKQKTLDLFIAPIVFWLILNLIILYTWEGFAFMIIPVYAILVTIALIFIFNLKIEISTIICALLAIPTVYICIPFLQMLPVGLGLKFLPINALLIVLLFGLLFPVFIFKQKLRVSSTISLCLSVALLLLASFNSSFNKDQKKPNSLNYVYDTDQQKAYWVTADKVLDTYTQQKLGKTPLPIPKELKRSHYLSYASYVPATAYPKLTSAQYRVINDLSIDGMRYLTLEVNLHRPINTFKLYTNTPISLKSLSVNGAIINNENDKFLIQKKRGTLLNYTLSDTNKDLIIALSIKENDNLDLTFKEISYDLQKHSFFNLIPRTDAMQPKAFMVNDAVITMKRIQL